MIFSIKVYLNNFNIEHTILETKQEIDQQYNEYYFKTNFYIPYLSWDYAKFFVKHENNILDQWEYIIKFTQQELETVQNQIETGSNIAQVSIEEEMINISNPKDAWKYFLKNKFSKIVTNF